MIAHAKSGPRDDSVPRWHQPFLKMLPAIHRHARIAFRHLGAEARAEMVEEVVANTFVAYRRLVEAGKVDLAYATPLAAYGIKQARAGRRVGGKLNVRDVTSRHCQVNKDVRVGRLDHFDEGTEEWKEVLVEDKHAGPAETAAARLDFGSWTESLPCRLRAIATTLATGETTKETANRFNVSSGRISQLRRELKTSWQAFQGEAPADLALA